MLAVQISRHGGPEELRLAELPDPVPGPGEALVRNSWIGVNYVDLQHRAGHPYPVQLPLIPGTEAAGTVTEVGDGADPGLVGVPVVHFGTLVLYGQSSGPVEPFGPGRLSGITGEGRGAGSLTLRWVAASHYLAGQHDRAAAVSAVLGQLGAGRLRPRIAERYPLGRAAEAHTRLASRTVAGKILLQAGSDG